MDFFVSHLQLSTILDSRVYIKAIFFWLFLQDFNGENSNYCYPFPMPCVEPQLYVRFCGVVSNPTNPLTRFDTNQFLTFFLSV